MLVLTRRNRESIVVGGSNTSAQLLRLTILEIQRGKVTLGIEADRDIPVHRLEIWEQICAEQEPREVCPRR